MSPLEHSTALISHLVDILHEKRESLGISKKKLSLLTGVSRTGINLMEAHERQPSVDLVARLAAGMGLKLSEIVKEAEDRMRAK